MSFDGLEYIASYADLSAAFGPNEDAGAAHYIQAGQREGRVVTFDGLEYIASYADLRTAFGANGDAGSIHFITNGRAEGRVTTFDGLEYIASYCRSRQCASAPTPTPARRTTSPNGAARGPRFRQLQRLSLPAQLRGLWRQRSATMSRPPPPTTSPTAASKAAPTLRSMRGRDRWPADHGARGLRSPRRHGDSINTGGYRGPLDQTVRKSRARASTLSASSAIGNIRRPAASGRVGPHGH